MLHCHRAVPGLRMQLMSVVAVGLGVCIWRTILYLSCGVQVVLCRRLVPRGTIFDRY